MYLSDFQYELPERLIAQKPADERTGSRLMVVDRSKGTVTHTRFEELKSYLAPADCLVLNDTRVMRARLLGRKASADGRGAGVEMLLLRELTGRTEAAWHGSIDETPSIQDGALREPAGSLWEVIARPGKRLGVGARVVFGDGLLNCEVAAKLPSGHRAVRFDCTPAEFATLVERFGRVPFPPYIKNADADPERYQTVYANRSIAAGSAAAPTAGLHFTGEYLDGLAASGVGLAYLTLHVGAGTFAPVKTDVIEEHHMHGEFYSVGEDAARKVNAVKTAGGGAPGNGDVLPGIGGAPRVVAVGTTSVRTLESVADAGGMIRPCEGWTDIFIYPGYKFRCADALLTNFHLPGSTLLMLVCAFAGYELAMEAYRRAVEAEYRFFSFGDAMFII